MTLRTCVDKLYNLNSNYSHPEHAINQASSLTALSKDLYSDPLRFLYELIQNADDARSSSIQISIIEKSFLVVGHQGKIFDEKDVRGLCSVGNGTKARRIDSTGYKGLGFKSVFGQSKYVVVMSNGEYFRFDASHPFQWTWTDIDRAAWEVENERRFEYPWHICPIWTEKKNLPAAVRTWVSSNASSYKVLIILRIENVPELSIALEDLSRQPQMFLFLRHIRDVDINIAPKFASNIV